MGGRCNLLKKRVINRINNYTKTNRCTCVAQLKMNCNKCSHVPICSAPDNMNLTNLTRMHEFEAKKSHEEGSQNASYKQKKECDLKKELDV